jgi:uncharacterized membrane protein YeaQ/YmgE (transglycosylase-associated protein family)
MNLVISILIGVAIGVMVELLLPGHTVSELALAILLGVAGALSARYVGEYGGWFGPQEPDSFVASALGAVIVLLIYGAFFRRSKSRPR